MTVEWNGIEFLISYIFCDIWNSPKRLIQHQGTEVEEWNVEDDYFSALTVRDAARAHNL